MISSEQHPKVNYATEVVAGISTYLTLSYIFVVNPILLSQIPGIDISRAFFATVISASIATLLMGVWARVPFAVAPAPSITTFFVSYVCLKLGLSWQSAMAAVVLSGLLSILMTWLAVRQNLIDSMPMALRVGIIFAVSGFLIATGMNQAKLITYSGSLIDLASFNLSVVISPNAVVLYTGLFTTVLFRSKWIGFSGAPLLGIFAATVAAAMFGIRSGTQAELSWSMVDDIGSLDFQPFLDPRFFFAIVVFFIIDFFGGVGKYVGLFTAMGPRTDEFEKEAMERSLYVDGVGNIVGGVVGASSLAVFISSAVGIAAGGRTGLVAIVAAILMLAGIVFIPVVGAIPVQAVSGILLFVAFLLIPYDLLRNRAVGSESSSLGRSDLLVCLTAAVVAFLTYKIDVAILVVFLFYSGQIVLLGKLQLSKHIILLVTTLLLLLAVLAQLFY